MTRTTKSPKPARTRWIEETFHPDWRIRLRADKILHEVKTKHQKLVIFENESWGRVLVLDGVIQLTTSDIFIYHEMIVHVPLMALARPTNVLVIGGGDGGVLREVLRHPSVRRATMVEIDRSVVELSLRYYPDIADGAFDDPRAELVIADGLKFIAETTDRYDAIIVDSSEPIGPSAVLHSRPFFADCARALKNTGILVTQNGMPNLCPDPVINTTQYFAELMDQVQPYLCTQPCYFGGPFAINMGVNGKADPQGMDLAALKRRFRARKLTTHYYTPDVHAAAFAIPPYVQTPFDKGRAKAARKQRTKRRG